MHFQSSIEVLRPVTYAVIISLAALAAIAADPPESLTPAQEHASFRLADERLTIELVAAEPEVLSPVAISFDADGRLFVAEMLDYPNAQTSGRIRLLEDRNGDGRHETATVFADKLPFPNGVLSWRGGVLVTAAPDIWYLSDTNGDGRADERRVLFTGFGLGNQQLRVNGLTWGLNYTLTTLDGKLLTGFISSETAASVTLRRAGEPDDTVLRSQIRGLRAEGKSLMPEGLEQGLTSQDMADLLFFLQKPEGRLLPDLK